MKPEPSFTREELLWLHDYLITGEMSQDEPSMELYFSMVRKLDGWKFPYEGPYCIHCGEEIENKATPSMGSPSKEFWVHYPGGYTLCEPLNPYTTVAAPEPGWDTDE